MNSLTCSYNVVKKFVFDSQVIILAPIARRLLHSLHVSLRAQLAYRVIGRQHAEAIAPDF